MSYEHECTLKAWNPRVISVSNSGFGPTGEWAERASFDGMAQSFTGITTVQGGGPSHTPRPVEWAFSDVVGVESSPPGHRRGCLYTGSYWARQLAATPRQLP